MTSQNQQQASPIKFPQFAPSYEENFYAAFGQQYQVRKPILINKENGKIIPFYDKNSQIDRAPIYQVEKDFHYQNQKQNMIIKLYNPKVEHFNRSQCGIICKDKNQKLAYQNKILNEEELTKNLQSLQKQVIELVQVDEGFVKDQDIQVIVQDKQELLLNRKFLKTEKILSALFNQLQNKLQKNKQFYFINQSTVIDENQTFKDLFECDDCCKLYLIQSEVIKLEENQICVTIVMDGVVQKVKPFNIKSQIVDSIQLEMKMEMIIYSYTDITLNYRNARFKNHFPNKSHCCLIVESKAKYYKSMIEVLDKLRQDYQQEYQRIKNNEHFEDDQVMDKITLDNFYYYNQLQQKFQFDYINKDIQKLFEQYNYYKLKPKYNETGNIIIDIKNLSENQLQHLTEKQIIKGNKYVQNQTNFIEEIQGTVWSKICLKCNKDFKENIEYDENEDPNIIVMKGCEHQLHSKCYYEDVIQQLKEKLRKGQIIQDKIQFKCFSPHCNVFQPLNEFQNKFSLRRQFEIQNIYLSYIIEHSDRKFLQCSSCLFIYLDEQFTGCPQCRQCIRNELLQ